MVRMVMTAVMKTGICTQALHHCLSGHKLRATTSMFIDSAASLLL